ncbi:MAG: hypothetical protein ACFFD4_24070 [Candidatus Odinarchaeota archaeon]
MSYIEKATYDYIKKVLTDGIKILMSRKFVAFSALLLLVAVFNTVISLGKDTLAISDDQLIWFFIIQIAVSLSFVIFGIFGKKIRRWIFRIAWVFLLSIIFFALLAVINLSGTELENVRNSLVQGLPIVFMALWCIIIPLSTFSFVKSMFYSKFTGTILFLGKPEEDNNSLFAGPVIICTFIGLFLSYFFITSASDLGSGLGTFTFVAGAVVGILSIYTFFVALGKIFRNDVFSSTLSFYFIMTLPILLMLGWAVLTGSGKTISGWNYFILVFSLIFSSQKVVRRTDVTAVEEKYPETESLSKKELKKLEKEKTKDDPFFMSKIIRFIGSEGLVFILLGSLLGYHLLQLQLYTGVQDNLFNQLTGGTQRVSIVYQSLLLFVMAFIVLFVSLSYGLSSSVRRFFKPVHYKIGFLPPYEQLKETLDGLKTGEIDWKTFVAGSSFKLALGGVKAGAAGTAKAGEAMLSGVANLFRRGKKKDED